MTRYARRGLITAAVAGGLLVAAALGAAVAFVLPSLTLAYELLFASAAIALAVIATNALTVRTVRVPRTTGGIELFFLDLPIVAPLLAFDGRIGPVLAAAALFTGFGIAAALRRGAAFAPIARHGLWRTAIALLAIGAAPSLDRLWNAPPPAGDALFAATIALAGVLYAALIGVPAVAASARIVPLRIARALLRDRRIWATGAGGILWAVVGRHAIAAAGIAGAAVVWAPIVVIAILLRALEEYRAEVHRLRLLRDAVQAMLGARDPLPQINAIMASLHGPLEDETVMLVAATGPQPQEWRTVATLGPAVSPAGDELRRRVIARLRFSGREHVVLRDEYYVVHAFAARLPNSEDLAGALVVHHRPGQERRARQRRFAAAARELAPLLRDYLSITAAHTAATVDPLTGLLNRATILAALDETIARMPAVGGCALLLVDLDHFKEINDRLGHAAGDACLRRVGQILRANIRGDDRAGRLGGEEFLVLMPGADAETARTVGERIRVAIAFAGLRHAGGEPVTASVGVAVLQPNETAADVLERVDRALYAAKARGRNQGVEAAG